MWSLNHSLALLDNRDIPWKQVIVGITLGNFVFQRYLDYRQYQVLKRKTPPATLKAEITQENFDKSQDYSRSKMKFKWIALTFSVVVDLIEIKYNLIAKFWSIGGLLLTKLSPILPSFMGGPITQSLCYLFVSLVAHLLLELPFDYYENFVVEDRYGFNKMTPKLFFTDFIKTYFVTAALVVPLVSAFLKIVDHFGSNFILYATGLFLVFTLVVQTVYPTFIAPLFNKFEPLEEGELKIAIENLAKEQRFPLTKLYKIDGSKRSAHSNAYFVGLPWSKQIVLYDTLIDHLTTAEVVAVLAHEIGHWKLSHLPKMLAYSQASLAFTFTLFNGFINNGLLYEAFGFNTIRPVIIGFSLFLYLFQPVQAITTFITHLLSRKHEYEADNYAKKCGFEKDLSSSLIKLTNENLLYVEAYWLYSAYHRSHPLLLERLAALNYVPLGKVGKGISPLKQQEEEAQEQPLKKDDEKIKQKEKADELKME
ncbi:M48 family metallopeptidase [Kocuria palustris]|nr:M48 family metallopeptidase [Kocuria palustris]